MRAAYYPDALDPYPFCSITPDRIWIETEHAIAFAASEPAADRHMVIRQPSPLLRKADKPSSGSLEG
jgi:hypothetical protein